jgi:hypothetical protein
MRTIVSVVILFSFYSSSWAGENKQKHSNLKSEITLISNPDTGILVKSWKIDDGKLHYRIDGNNSEVIILMSEIARLEEKVGDHTWTGFWWGFAPLTVWGTTFTAMKYGSTSGWKSMPIYALVSILPGGIGALIGYFSDDWEEVDMSPYKKNDMSVNFTPAYNLQTKSMGINLLINF